MVLLELSAVLNGVKFYVGNGLEGGTFTFIGPKYYIGPKCLISNLPFHSDTLGFSSTSRPKANLTG